MPQDGYIMDPKKMGIYVQKSVDCFALGSDRFTGDRANAKP
jgi:hypothetical protein